MSNCKQCLCEKVCRYNDGHNLYCKEDYKCPHFASDEKQIPKKVNNLEIFSDIGACVPATKSGNCPTCNNFMIGNHTYCNDCGQALDWSDTE